MNVRKYRVAESGRFAALIAIYLCVAPMGSLVVMAQSDKPDAGHSSSENIARLLGIYESVPVNKSLPDLPMATPASLDNLPLTPAATLETSKRVGPDPKDMCQVLGPFRLMARPDIRFEILYDHPNKIVMLFENGSWGYLRTIRINAEHIRDFSKIRPMWNGDSIASWERDTLVVDTIHFTNKTWLNELGITNSKQLHLSERLRLVDGGKYLEYRATAVDTNVLTQPASYTRYFRRSAREITEYNCYLHKTTPSASSP